MTDSLTSATVSLLIFRPTNLIAIMVIAFAIAAGCGFDFGWGDDTKRRISGGVFSVQLGPKYNSANSYVRYHFHPPTPSVTFAIPSHDIRSDPAPQLTTITIFDKQMPSTCFARVDGTLIRCYKICHYVPTRQCGRVRSKPHV